MHLFMESMQVDLEGDSAPQLQGEVTWGDKPPSMDMIYRGIHNLEALFCTDQAAQAGMGREQIASTLVVLAQGLEKKAHLQECAIKVYEAALEPRHDLEGWERCVATQLLAGLQLKRNLYGDAESRLDDCVALMKETDGHPRDEVLFGGGLKSHHTRREFAALIEKLRVKLYHDLGDTAKAHQHMAEVKRLTAPVTGDLVQQASAGGAVGAGYQAGGSSGSSAAPTKSEDPRERAAADLWKAKPSEERVVSEYLYVDEGPSVIVMVELNEHLGIGGDASSYVESLQQFRVRCEPLFVEVLLRLRKDGKIWEFKMVLNPLAREIIPEDTVPKLRGKEGRRRLEVRLFKLDKHINWHGDIVGKPARKEKPADAVKAAKKGTALNPLTAEEIAALPTPGSASQVARTSPTPTPAPAREERPVETQDAAPALDEMD